MSERPEVIIAAFDPVNALRQKASDNPEQSVTSRDVTVTGRFDPLVPLPEPKLKGPSEMKGAKQVHSNYVFSHGKNDVRPPAT
jgi:hypothetical protein